MNQIHIPELTIEPCDDGTLLLEQDTGGNVDRVQLHPLHIRLIAERFGLAPSGDPTAARTIARLERRLRLVRDEVELLDSWLHAESSADRINLEEMVKARDILTMLNEFIEDFDAEVLPRSQPSASGAGSPPKPAAVPNCEAPQSEPQQLTL